jgi:2-polyprenyl-3-methyl-5-hydroxy-6-metoxy-1,4-benzoquinol methylase
MRYNYVMASTTKFKLWILSPLKYFFDTVFSPVYKRSIAHELAHMCPHGAHILDFGCNDGSLAQMILTLDPSLTIEGVDIQDTWNCSIPRRIYDGKKLPFATNSFDVVIAVDVLHHTTNTEQLLQEIRRVSKNLVIIKDHMVYSNWSFMFVCFTDYISNVANGIICVFHYLRRDEWKRLFRSAHLTLTKTVQDMEYGFGINGYFNPIFVLEKSTS